jgi:hypothetical protein
MKYTTYNTMGKLENGCFDNMNLLFKQLYWFANTCEFPEPID